MKLWVEHTWERFHGVVDKVGQNVDLGIGDVIAEGSDCIFQRPWAEGSFSGEGRHCTSSVNWAQLQVEGGEDEVDDGGLDAEGHGHDANQDAEKAEEERGEKLGQDDCCEDNEEEWDEFAQLGANVVASFVCELVASLVIVTVASLLVITSWCIVASSWSSVASARSWKVSKAGGHQGEEEGSLEHLTDLREEKEDERVQQSLSRSLASLFLLMKASARQTG